MHRLHAGGQEHSLASADWYHADDFLVLQHPSQLRLVGYLYALTTRLLKVVVIGRLKAHGPTITAAAQLSLDD